MKLNKLQIDLLRKSLVEKWNLIPEGKASDDRCDNCSLCDEFNPDDCSRCPVFLEVGERGCRSTPWVKWNEYCEYNDPDLIDFENPWPKKVFDEKSKQYAEAERNFLQRILDEAELCDD